MNCRTAELLLPLLAGSDLDADRARDVREHVSGCERCRALEGELETSREWLVSERPPFSEEDYAAVRRGVWREIEARGAWERAVRPGRLAVTGGALLGAVLVALLWHRPRTAGPAPAAAIAITAPAPASVAAATPQPSVEERSVPAPVRLPRQQALAPVRARAEAAEGVAVKIEFQTANPDVRIIWLVKNGEAAPRPSPAGRIEEVS